jgi:invasion protein IalB
MKCRDIRTPRGLAAALLMAGLVTAPSVWGQTAAPAPAEAPDLPRKLEDYGDWRALATGSGDDRACYVTQKAVPAPPEGRAKDRPLLYVTHRPGRNALNVVAYFAGYTVKPDSDVELDFGFSKFRLFTQDGSNGAWSPNPDVDGRIVEAMRAGAVVTVRGIDESGREVADAFSLQGFTAAMWRATQECTAR